MIRSDLFARRRVLMESWTQYLAASWFWIRLPSADPTTV